MTFDPDFVAEMVKAMTPTQTPSTPSRRRGRRSTNQPGYRPRSERVPSTIVVRVSRCHLITRTGRGDAWAIAPFNSLPSTLPQVDGWYQIKYRAPRGQRGQVSKAMTLKALADGRAEVVDWISLEPSSPVSQRYEDRVWDIEA